MIASIFLTFFCWCCVIHVFEFVFDSVKLSSFVKVVLVVSIDFCSSKMFFSSSGCLTLFV